MRLSVLVFLATAWSIPGWANSSGAPLNTTGAPGNITCAQVGCHSSFPLNSGSGRLTIAAATGANIYTAGQTVRIRVTLEDPTAVRWGFNLTVRKEGSPDFAGSFAVPSSPTPAIVAVRSDGSTRFATHSPNGTFRTQRTQVSWEFDWTPPAAGSGPVRFYAAGNAANNSGDEGGDRIYTTNFALAEAASSGSLSVGNTVLPQFVFGGGWTSSIYLTNPTAAAVSFPVRFYNDSAVELELGGSASRQITIPPRGTALIQAPNSGSLTQGWATWDAPAGLTGYGVFRQSAPGVPDQEAVVPFAAANANSASLTFDDSNLVTAAAVWFNGPSGATVTILARDESGAQIGTAALAMTPGTKRAFAVVEQIPAVSGRRGVLEFSTSGGNIAVLGLRFAGSAFTSIPAAP
jgi:hypothetical protein